MVRLSECQEPSRFFELEISIAGAWSAILYLQVMSWNSCRSCLAHIRKYFDVSCIIKYYQKQIVSGEKEPLFGTITE